MEFCPRCGSILVKKTKRFACSKCSYSKAGKLKIQSSEKMEEKQKIGLLKEQESSVWPVTSNTCPKCGNKTAYSWSVQMRAADEAETNFFRCTKCKNQWRERG